MLIQQTPTILIYDSGLGGLTVFREVRKARPDARFIYAADDAAFPYGRLSPEELVARVLFVMERLIAAHVPDLVVIACNTASTLVLPHLRARCTVPFVGTVPAIKPAAQLSRTKRISVLATPGTVARDYTHDLIRTYAADCQVTLVGSTALAAMAEAEMAGVPVPSADIAREIAPCFVEDAGGRTDTIVLACTHYPLLLKRFEQIVEAGSFWPVTWIDPAPAIARRVAELLGGRPAATNPPPAPLAIFTAPDGETNRARKALAGQGIGDIRVEPLPYVR